MGKNCRYDIPMGALNVSLWNTIDNSHSQLMWPTTSFVSLSPADPTLVPEPVSQRAPSFTYFTLGGVCAIVVVAILIVALLAVVAYRRCVWCTRNLYSESYVFTFSHSANTLTALTIAKTSMKGYSCIVSRSWPLTSPPFQWMMSLVVEKGSGEHPILFLSVPLTRSIQIT